MSSENKNSIWKIAFWLPLLLYVVTGILGWFANQWFGPKKVDEDLLNKMKEIQQQTKNLDAGFEKVVNAILLSGTKNQEVTTTINNYISNYNQLATTINNTAKEFKVDIPPIDITRKPIAEKTEPAPPPVQPPVDTPQEYTIQVDMNDKQVKRINSYNQFAVVKEDQQRGVLRVGINLNGNLRMLAPGDQTAIFDEDKSRLWLVYDGKTATSYLFRVVKRN